MSVRALAHWVAVNNTPGLGPRRIAAVFREYGDIDLFFSRDWPRLASVTGLSAEAAKKVLSAVDLHQSRKHIESCQRKGIHLLHMASDRYPVLLREINDPPPLLYYRGTLPTGEQRLIAVVGSRKATGYGRGVAQDLTGALVRAGVGVVSGLAMGIDGAAHKSCLDAQGYSIAVLGCGIDICYPQANKGLKAQLETTGCVLSEFAPATGPVACNFPRRNRIISGLSSGVLVVEATPKSGAMITVGFALEQGRDVFAVPGNINSPQSEGTNQLIQQGAKPVLNAGDILDEYGLTQVALATNTVKTDVGHTRLLELVDYQGITIDHLCTLTQLPESIILAMLVALELKGLVIRRPGQKYLRNPGVEVEN